MSRINILCIILLCAAWIAVSPVPAYSQQSNSTSSLTLLEGAQEYQSEGVGDIGYSGGAIAAVRIKQQPNAQTVKGEKLFFSAIVAEESLQNQSKLCLKIKAQVPKLSNANEWEEYWANRVYSVLPKQSNSHLVQYDSKFLPQLISISPSKIVARLFLGSCFGSREQVYFPISWGEIEPAKDREIEIYYLVSNLSSVNRVEINTDYNNKYIPCNSIGRQTRHNYVCVLASGYFNPNYVTNLTIRVFSERSDGEGQKTNGSNEVSTSTSLSIFYPGTKLSD